MTAIFDTLYFLFRYIPFWSIPCIIICMQFGYIYWIKEVRWVSYVFFSSAFVNFLFLVYYIIAGSPERSAQWLDDAVRAI
ncbi:MAG: hypothetical protein VXV96_04805 [Bdellovibrionota bacterium]|jgi:hypothetical protein|nr:hypothetical protein [Bdellovibrionota bacterium]